MPPASQAGRAARAPPPVKRPGLEAGTCVRHARLVSVVTRFVSRPPESYSDAEWLLRKGVRNVQWIRREGVRRLVEEHDLHPIGDAAAALERARWRRSHPLPPG